MFFRRSLSSFGLPQTKMGPPKKSSLISLLRIEISLQRPESNGIPRIKSTASTNDRDITCRSNLHYKLLGHGRIKILGRAYRFNESRAIPGLVKTVTVRRDALKDIYLTFSCDQVPQPEPAPKTGQSAGADFGLKDFLTLSTGEKIAAPLPLKAELRHLRKAQRVLSRKQKGSKARNRARLDVARVHKKVANVRNDWQWKQARLLVTVFDLLVFETLNIKAMHQLWGRKVGDLRIRTQRVQLGAEDPEATEWSIIPEHSSTEKDHPQTAPARGSRPNIPCLQRGVSRLSFGR